VRLALVLATWLALAAAAGACTASTSKRCREVCAQEAKCRETVELTQPSESGFDEGECVAACAALERDTQTVGIVEAHVACVDHAGSACAAVLQCK
jgi:hypothetical protein